MKHRGPPRVSRDEIDAMIALAKIGRTATEIADTVGWSYKTVLDHLRAAGVKPPPAPRKPPRVCATEGCGVEVRQPRVGGLCRNCWARTVKARDAVPVITMRGVVRMGDPCPIARRRVEAARMTLRVSDRTAETWMLEAMRAAGVPL